MSSSLVKLGLSLFGDDLRETEAPIKKRKKAKDPMSLISTNRKGVKKELRKLEQKKRQAKKTGKHQTQHKYHTEDPIDYTEQSVEALRRISQLDSTDKTITKSVFTYHHQGKLKAQEQVKQKRNNKSSKKEEESTLFTDQDFENFMADYDFSKNSKKKS